MLKFLTINLPLAILLTITASSQHRILLDENKLDWITVQTAWSSTSSTHGIALNEFKVTNDEDFVFLYFKSDETYSLQSSSGINLYIDTDNNYNTGFKKDSIGAEIVFNFGQRSGTAYLNNTQQSISFSDLFMVTAPTIDSDWFEVAISRDAKIGNNNVFNASNIKLILSDQSDINGASTGAVNYTLMNSSVDPLPVYSFTKIEDNHLRVLAHNVQFDGFFEEAKKPAYERLYKVIEPDIIGFSEIYNHSGTQVANRLEEMLPSPTGKQWNATNIQDNFVATRYTIKSSWAAGGFGNGVFLLDLRPDYNTDALVVVAHPPCCDNDATRQTEVDAIMSFIREAKQPGGDLALNDSTPIIIMGDMNFVGKQQQVTTLLTGNIVDEATYGNDFTPDWNGNPFVDAKPYVTNLPMTFTQGTSTSPGSFTKGRLDYIVYSGSVLDLQNSFVLYTNTLSPAQLTANNLLFNDTEVSSDHFPVVSDFKVTERSFSPLTTISDLRMNNSEGIPQSLNSLKTVEGIVTVGQEFGNSGPAFMQDNNAGIALFGADLINGLTIGDQINITAPIGFFNGLTEFVYEAGKVSVTINSRNNSALPTVVTIDQILNQDWNGFEKYEGMLVELQNVNILGSGAIQSNMNYTISDGINSMQLRVDDMVDLSGIEITDDPFNIVGVISQFDPSSPYSEGYSINPRFSADIKKQKINTIADIRANNVNGVPNLLNKIVTTAGVVTVHSQFGSAGPAYMQDETGGLALYGASFADKFESGDLILITSRLSQYNGLTQLVYEADSTNITIIEKNVVGTPPTVTIQDILNQTWNVIEEYEGRVVRIEQASISETGQFEGNTSYTLTDATGSMTLRIDNDVNLVGKNIPTGIIAITGIISQFDFSEPYSEGYQLLPFDINNIQESGTANKITKENLILHHDTENGVAANTIATQLQEKLDYFKRYTQKGFYDNEKVFTLHYSTNLAEFNANKPAGTEAFQSSYLVEGDIIYFMEPTTVEQKNYMATTQQAAMFGLARGVIRNEYKNRVLKEWLEYGFASMHAGLAPAPNYIKQQVQSFGRKPIISDFSDWDNITQFDKYAFAHTLAEFIERKFQFPYIWYNVDFNNNLTFRFWSIKDEAKFNEVWSKYLDLFYLNPDVMKVQVSTANFTVFAANEDNEYAQEYATLLEETLARYSTQLEFTLKQKIQMFIYPSLCDYHNSVGVDECNPNSIGGGVGIDKFQMVTPHEILRPVEKIHALAMHEFAHVFQFNIYPNFLPPWMSEGFASFMPGGILTEEEIEALRPYVNQQFEQMFATTGRYPTVDDLSDRDKINQYNLDYYLLGQAMVDYIVRTHGFIPLKEFIKSGGVDFTKLGYANKMEFQNAWFAFYDETYKNINITKSLDAKKTLSAIQIDGNISESVWNVSETIGKNLFGDHNNTATFGVLWDDTYLYVAAKVLDDKLINDGGPSYENDGVEIFIDADFNKGTSYDSFDRQFRRNYNDSNIYELNNKTNGVRHALKTITGGYTVELAIPWTNLGITASANTTIGFDIANNDGDTGGGKDNQTVWNGIVDNWRNTSQFGELTLSSETVGNKAQLSIQAPLNDEILLSGTEYFISWSSANVQNIDIDFSLDNGQQWQSVAKNISAVDSSYAWKVPSLESPSSILKVKDSSDPNITSTSEKFTILNPNLTVLSPNGDEKWSLESSQNITWQSSHLQKVNIEYSFDNGENWIVIKDSVDATLGIYNWIVFGEPSDQNLIKVTATNYLELFDVSDANFSIEKSTGIEQAIGGVPNNYALYQNYPNPFNPSTTIKYSIPEAGHVSINVYNLLGKKVATLINKLNPAGNYEVQFDASRLSSGVYIYIIETEKYKSSKKLILLK